MRNGSTNSTLLGFGRVSFAALSLQEDAEQMSSPYRCLCPLHSFWQQRSHLELLPSFLTTETLSCSFLPPLLLKITVGSCSPWEQCLKCFVQAERNPGSPSSFLNLARDLIPRRLLEFQQQTTLTLGDKWGLSNFQPTLRVDKMICCIWWLSHLKRLWTANKFLNSSSKWVWVVFLTHWSSTVIKKAHWRWVKRRFLLC